MTVFSPQPIQGSNGCRRAARKRPMRILVGVALLLASQSAHAADDLSLPDPLKTLSGAAVQSAGDWQTIRRPEVLELFRSNVYGRAPIGRPADLRFETRETSPDAMDGAATRKQIDILFSGPGGGGKIRLLLFVPRSAPGPAPAFLLICNRGPENIDPTRRTRSPFWPAERIVARGYAAAVFLNADADPDRPDGFKDGVHGIFDPPGVPRPPDAWGTIAAWAWAASRAMDCLQADADIDAKRVAVVGHSRGGKTALWAGAEDERFALVVSNNSGCTGAALARRRQGETVKAINDRFPHWFCDNYKRFNDKESELPVDQHLLIALAAPRLVYVASASRDNWADPPGEFLSCVHAGPVYGLFGLAGLETAVMPEPGRPLLGGHIGYHLREGGHDLTEYDWDRFMDFADRHWKRRKAP